MDLLQNPRYKDRPVYLFFEKYVLDIIGELGEDKIKVLDGLNLHQIFGTQASDWRGVIEEALQLSQTIQIAILDQWYLYVDKKRDQGEEPDADKFTHEFVDAYFEEGSRIDVWKDSAELEAAKQRILMAQQHSEAEV